MSAAAATNKGMIFFRIDSVKRVVGRVTANAATFRPSQPKIGAAAPLPPWAGWLKPQLAVSGAILYGWAVAHMLNAWLSRFGAALLQIHGAAPSLVAAALGLLALLALGAAHGVGLLPARPAVAGFVIAFLLPLVIGAASHLLPVWLRPGVQDQWHGALRARLVRWGGVRGLSLLLLGLAIAVLP